MKRIVKDSSVFLGGGISKSSKHEQNSIRVCDDSLKTFTSKAISFKKDNKSVCDPDWDIFEKEQRRFREVLERDGIDNDEEEEALVPGLFEFAVYGRRVKEHTSNSSNESSSSHDDDEEDEEEKEKEKEKEEKNRRRRRGKTSIEDKSKENLLHKALISFRHVKRATAQLKQLSQNSRVPVVVLRVKSSRRNGAMTYYARDIRDVKEFENLDVREKLLREEENLHEMYNSSHHVNNKNGKENESHKNEDDITSKPLVEVLSLRMIFSPRVRRR